MIFHGYVQVTYGARQTCPWQDIYEQMRRVQSAPCEGDIAWVPGLQKLSVLRLLMSKSHIRPADASCQVNVEGAPADSAHFL